MPPPRPLNRVLGALRAGESTPPPQEPVADALMQWTGWLASAAFDAALLFDASGRIRAANAPACELLGADYPPPPGEIIGQTVLEATHARALSELCADVAGEPSANGPREETVRLVGPGTGRQVRARAARLPAGAEGAAGDVLLLLRDDTELEHLRRVRTEFVANVSHELRTPLASIRATAETLLDGAMEDPDAARRFLKTIIREADRLVRLSTDLLELSKAESTEQRERRRFDLSALAIDVAARLLGQAERRQVTLGFDPAPPPPVEIEADRSEIDQVLFNLLDNAIKYTPSAGKVTVTVEPRPEAGMVALTVADTGIGILSQDLPRIFERFWRADRARRFAPAAPDENRGESGGTGLGLSIVKHIVETHKGSVAAESELGLGSRFTVTLPLPPPGHASVTAPLRNTTGKEEDCQES